MDSLKSYSDIIKATLKSHVDLCQHGNNNHEQGNNTETFLVSDDAQGHYSWMTIGWQKGKRVCGMTAYIRLHQDKVWIEEDCTEEGIANDLIKAGIPKDKIVLGFHSPQLRQYSEFTVA
jgi:hypothetical protein